MQPSVAKATCRKTCLSQIILLQYKAKPYLGFQNLGRHSKILGCHFDTQKRLEKTLSYALKVSYFYAVQNTGRLPGLAITKITIHKIH